jgi:hypothetical protein
MEVRAAIPWKPKSWKTFRSSEAPAPDVGSCPAMERRIFLGVKFLFLKKLLLLRIPNYLLFAEGYANIF